MKNSANFKKPTTINSILISKSKLEKEKIIKRTNDLSDAIRADFSSRYLPDYQEIAQIDKENKDSEKDNEKENTINEPNTEKHAEGELHIEQNNNKNQTEQNNEQNSNKESKHEKSILEQLLDNWYIKKK